MELASIEKLVEKYENAETTLQEEATLKAYFLSDNVAPHLEEYQMMFTYFQISKDETYTKTIELKTKKKRNFKWLSVAASVVLLFSVYLGNEKMNEIQERKQAEQTLAEVTNALKMLSGNLKKGNEAFNNLYAYEDSVNKIFKTK
ncbi:MAG: hypothetical protein ABF244_06475 [Flavobacteriaceae bacterium]|jgi:hypothetical protein|tara:strand:+ start:54930 stop:55364 length:435 start_codon:yes stop_codon:yes gene_type:complete